jgi:hypothetical protein
VKWPPFLQAKHCQQATRSSSFLERQEIDGEFVCPSTMRTEPEWCLEIMRICKSCMLVYLLSNFMPLGSLLVKVVKSFVIYFSFNKHAIHFWAELLWFTCY